MRIERPFAFCCPGPVEFCDCVNKDHGTAFFDTNEGSSMSPLEIKAARIALGMNQRELAEALEVASEATVRSWEAGRRPISGPARVAIRLMLKHGRQG